MRRIKRDLLLLFFSFSGLFWFSAKCLGEEAGTQEASEIAPALEGTDIKVALPEVKKVPSYWCVFHHKEGQVGEWKKYAGQDLTGKRVALIVHGHNTTSLINAIANLVLGDKLGKTLGFEDKFDYGLNELVHLGRFLSGVSMPDDPTKKRFDYVLGFAYNTAYPLKTLADHFSNEASTFLEPCGSVVLFAHSMGGLVTRWALERRGLGAKYKYLITLASPHQGVIAPITRKVLKTVLPASSLSTLDMMTASPEKKKAKFSKFLKELNESDSPFVRTAHYFTLVGNHSKDLTRDPPPYNKPDVEDSMFNIGYLIQKAISAYAWWKDWGEIETDGLVPTYSAQSDYLKDKSLSYAQDPTRTKVLPLNHRTITGSAHGYKDGKIPRKSPQYRVGQVLTEWLNLIPVDAR
jgi:hypothetical protein